MKTLFALTLLILSVNAKNWTFPSDFVFGAATASYQIEGAWNVDGKLESIWDEVAHRSPSVIYDSSTGDEAALSYYFYEKDIQALKEVGFKVYRFSIAWTRVLKKNLEVNQAGMNYYKNLIRRLKEEGIEPMVTIYHWDLPLWIQDLGGWTNPDTVKYFVHYAKTLFEHLGPDVKEWITFNEPAVFCDLGYSWASHAPLIGTERQIGGYLCVHHILLAHAAVYKLYKSDYFAVQQGKVGICFNTGYSFPYNSSVTQETVDKALEFSLGRFAHPIFSAEGDYPPVVRDAIAAKSANEGRRWSRLPKFTAQEIQDLRGSSDFLALNYYSSGLVYPFSDTDDKSWSDNEIHGAIDPSWPQAESDWLYSIPDGLYQLLMWMKLHYNNPDVLITENGWSDKPMTIDDVGRQKYLKGHLAAMARAIEDGCNVKKYTAWSLVDNFEWMRGYSERFGIFAIDLNDPERPRIKKDSVQIFKDVILTMQIDDEGEYPEGNN